MSLACRLLRCQSQASTSRHIILPQRRWLLTSAVVRCAGAAGSEAAGAKAAGAKAGRFYEVRRLFRLAKPVQGRLAAGVALLALSSTVTVSVPFLVGRFMDSFLSEGKGGDGDKDPAKPKGLDLPLLDDLTAKLPAVFKGSGGADGSSAQTMERLKGVCLVLSGIFVVGAAANFGRSYLMITAGQVVTNRLRQSVYASILRQDIAFFDRGVSHQSGLNRSKSKAAWSWSAEWEKRERGDGLRSKSGELVNRLSNDVSTVGSSVTMNVSDGLRSLVAATAGTAMMDRVKLIAQEASFFEGLNLTGHFNATFKRVVVSPMKGAKMMREDERLAYISYRSSKPLLLYHTCELRETRLRNLPPVFRGAYSSLLTAPEMSDKIRGPFELQFDILCDAWRHMGCPNSMRWKPLTYDQMEDFFNLMTGIFVVLMLGFCVERYFVRIKKRLAFFCDPPKFRSKKESQL